jgi:hypothetical protein
VRKSIAAGFGVGLAFAAGIALAQVGTIVSYVGSPYIPLATGVAGYQKASPTSGTMTFQKGQSEMVIGGSGTITALTIALNPAPYDGQKNCFYTKPAITTLTMSATLPTGVTLNDGVASTSATSQYCYLYSASNNAWDRSH